MDAQQVQDFMDDMEATVIAHQLKLEEFESQLQEELNVIRARIRTIEMALERGGLS